MTDPNKGPSFQERIRRIHRRQSDALRRVLSRSTAEPTESWRPDRIAATDHRVGVTTDRNDPGLRDIRPDGMQRKYLVLSDEERSRGFVRPVRHKYLHSRCGAVTTMGKSLAETYARDPKFYGGTYCATCLDHFPVGADGEFTWDDGSGQKVGT